MNDPENQSSGDIHTCCFNEQDTENRIDYRKCKKYLDWLIDRESSNYRKSNSNSVTWAWLIMDCLGRYPYSYSYIRPFVVLTILCFSFKFWERIKLYLMPPKHQPDFSFLRHVPLRRVHLFTVVQIVCLAVLWVLKSTFLAIIFPVMVSVLFCILVAWRGIHQGTRYGEFITFKGCLGLEINI